MSVRGIGTGGWRRAVRTAMGAGIGVLLASSPARAEEPVVLVVGPVHLEVHVSRTAHLFHVVDQLSGWSPFCHAQYRRAFEADEGLSADDLAALARHAALRKRKGWGQGLEQTFYTPLPLAQALAAGVRAGRLTAAEAEAEGEVLSHFGPRVDAFTSRRRSSVLAFCDRVVAWRERLTADLTPLARLCAVRDLEVPIYLIANPVGSALGGGYNGGRVALEVGETEDTYATLLHELFHALLAPRHEALEEAARGAPSLDAETVGEGLCYALAPGLVHDGPDRLARVASRDLAAGRRLWDAYVRFNRLGLCVRPMLREALQSEDATLDGLLSRVVDAWVALLELESAKPTAYVLGPAWRAATTRLRDELHVDVFSFHHDAGAYEKSLFYPRGGVVVLLFAADSPDRDVPENVRDLLPIPWAQLLEDLQRGGTLEKEGHARGRRVVMLLAPTTAALGELVGKTALLARAD